jgi:hypothetical protein
VRLEGLGQLKNPVISSGIEPRDLPVCNTVPQPTTLSRAPENNVEGSDYGNNEKYYPSIHPQEKKKSREASVKIVGSPAGIQTRYLQNTG